MAPNVNALLVSVLLASPAVQASSAESHANPLRKVVTMLQDMQNKVIEEGKTEEGLFNKFMCYCKTSGGDLDASITAAEEKITSAGSEVEAKSELKTTTEADLKAHQTSRADAEATMAEATELRNKEAAEFAKTKSDLDTNIAAITKAVAALEKGAAGAFLQSSAVAVVKNFVIDRANLPDATRQELLVFLSGGQGEKYAPQSGEIIGILQTLGDEMQKDLGDATNTESAAIANFEGMMAAKKQEVATLQQQIETEMERVGRLGMEIAEISNDLEDTKEALSADQKFKLEMASSCGTKEKEWEEIKKTRADELVALSETIKVLNDDDALELFKQTLPSSSASFVQVEVAAAAQRARALALVRTAAKAAHSPALDLIAVALNGKQAGFEQVIKMIDEMIVNLKDEQKGDDSKLEYCSAALDEAEDKQKEQKQSIDDSSAAIAELEGSLATLTEEIKALQDGIKACDKSVAEATEQRKQENEEHKALMQADGTAKEVLAWAKNRLNKFYNPSQHKEAPKRELSEEETPAPGGIAGTGIGAAAALVQIRSHNVAAPPPPPETFKAYTKKGQESNAVIAMIDLLINDLDKEMQVSEVSEKDAQADYETMMQDAGDKRAADVQSLTQKEGAKADTEVALDNEKDKKTATTQELMNTDKNIADLHAECDWLLKYHEVRKTARANEVDSLTNAKAVLSGADLSLIQASSSSLRGARLT